MILTDQVNKTGALRNIEILKEIITENKKNPYTFAFKILLFLRKT